MTPSTDLAQRAIDFIRDRLPALLAVAVVETATGQLLASYAASPRYALPAVAAATAAAVRQQVQHTTPEEALEDVLIALMNQIHLIKLSADGQAFLFLAVDAPSTNNVGFAREMLRQSASLLA